MSNAILTIENISKSFGGLKVLKGIDLVVNQKEIIGIMGPNGSGKTVLFDIISGHIRPDHGKIFYGENKLNLIKTKESDRFHLGITRTYQHLNLFSSLSVIENIEAGLVKKSPLYYLRSLLNSKSDVNDEINDKKNIGVILKLFDKHLKKYKDENCLSLSYANRRRLEFSRALVCKPRLILLDEPTAGMNPKETLELQIIISKLKNRGITFLIIEHKLFFLEDLVNRLVILNEGEKITEGSVETVRENKKVIEAYLGVDYVTGD